jgi:hypothetical protein
MPAIQRIAIEQINPFRLRFGVEGCGQKQHAGGDRNNGPTKTFLQRCFAHFVHPLGLRISFEHRIIFGPG